MCAKNQEMLLYFIIIFALPLFLLFIREVLGFGLRLLSNDIFNIFSNRYVLMDVFGLIFRTSSRYNGRCI